MQNMIDLSNALGKADDDFVNNVKYTLANIKINSDRKDKKIVKRTNFRLVALIAVICVLCAGTALALTNTWGILDFLSGRMNDVEVLPEAAEIVQNEVAQSGGQTDFATFSVREAVFDGQNVYIVVEVKPSKDEYLLLGSDTNPSDSVGNMGPLFADRTGTIANYARENNKKLIRTSLGIEGVNQSLDFLLEDDNTLVFMINSSITDGSSELNLNINCVAAPFVSKEGDIIDETNMKRTSLSVVLENTGTKDVVISSEPVIYSDCGVQVDKVTLTGSAMAIYAEIEFTVIDKEKFAETEEGLWFEFLDSNGERLPNGAGSGSIEKIDDNHYVQKSQLQAAESLPGEIILRAFNCWEKNRYETHTFEMK
ncbi:MAG: hypothetical protein CVU91_08465 [Firmicutes bacterium HGW-Firmicutes-16]|nr:MAG: hypothetical protein CVU91_08465 [Firmicutes bacterium HGW-Firmicutes-16]